MTVFVDANVPMYLVGGEHPNKEAAVARLDELLISGERLVTDAEAFQELLHRYGAIRRLDAVQPAFDALLAVVDDVIEVGLDDVEEAKRILLGGTSVSARDALHLAVMARAGLTRILSFDSGYDAFPRIERLF